ncbi:MAG: hypothetical protein HYY10_03220 [Candidatus Liptonbacteria bacterium]|nr:hypothetical protein [Candidatus Liptonbacteria bacterium]
MREPRFFPLFPKCRGLSIITSLNKSGDDTVVSVLLFNSKEEADASIVTSRQFVKENGVESLYQLQELIAGEVVVKG